MDGITPETCAECGFDSRLWARRDAGTVFFALGMWWRLATDGIATGVLNTRPESDVWSALEYGVHSALVTAVLREGIAMILTTDDLALPEPPKGADAVGDPVVLDPDAVVADLEREGTALVALVNEVRGDAWQHLGRLPDGPVVQAEAALVHAVHDATHHHMDVGRGLAALGAGAPRHTGSVAQVNASSGGVPKRAVAGGRIGYDGLEGDRQANRKHHGRPFQALCLWSTEVLDQLAAEGHPIGPGFAGENLTLAGVDWPALRPGTRLRIGSALAEVSYPAVPCANQTPWFSDGDFQRIAHDRNPDLVRWYAWVREPGEVRTGDEVIVQP